MLTLASGVKYVADITQSVKLGAKVNATYDLIQNGDAARIYYSMQNATATEHFTELSPFGVELGANLGTQFENGINLTLDCLFNARKDFNGISGALRMHYVF